MSIEQQLNKLIKKSKKNMEKREKMRLFRLNTIFVVEGEFDMTRLQELPFGIVDYCLSFLTAKDKVTGLPSLWFQRLAFQELNNVWNEKYAPVLKKRFEKMTRKQLTDLTSNCHSEFYFEGGTQRKKSFIHDVCQFPRFYNNYTNQRRNCIEIILMSKGMSAKEQRRYVDIDPFANAKITLKDLTLKSL